MTPDRRTDWLRSVLGCEALTAAQKTVLIALDTYADYRDGTNAHPGEVNLAAMCNLSTRAVRSALDRGQTLGLIERTSRANPKAGRAAVYRLVLPTTGTVVPVHNLHDRQDRAGRKPTTGTAVPVDNSHHRHGHDISTGTAVPPTLTSTLNNNGLRKPGTSLAACPDCSGTHWLTDDDGTPTGRCTHPRLAAVAHG